MKQGKCLLTALVALLQHLALNTSARVGQHADGISVTVPEIPRSTKTSWSSGIAKRHGRQKEPEPGRTKTGELGEGAELKFPHVAFCVEPALLICLGTSTAELFV